MRKKLIAGNWKMHGTKAWAQELARGVAQGVTKGVGDYSGLDFLVCPSFPLIYPVADVLSDSPVLLGAQDCHPAEQGAHTGDTSPVTLADAGVTHVIVGHSERRVDHAETDSMVQGKAQSVLANGMVAVICIGETEDEQMNGQTETILRGQILGSVPDNATADTVVIAYEPVWAIGTGKTPIANDVQNTHAFIRSVLAEKLGSEVAGAMKILYGGSVKPANAGELLTLPDVDGALVGGASLKADDFLGIADAIC